MRSSFRYCVLALAVLVATLSAVPASSTPAEPTEVSPAAAVLTGAGTGAAEHGVAEPTTPTTGCTIAPFVDVGVDHPFCADITWLVERDLATGYDDGTFRPTEPVSRQAMAAFLYRYAGPITWPVPGAPTFSDVGPDHPFHVEIEWLAAEGIAAGYDDGTFRPTEPVSRQATAAFLFRLHSPEWFYAEPFANFVDVGPGHPFFTEVEWLVEVGVTTGFDDSTFRPTNAVSRQAMAAFVHRYDDEFGFVPDGFVDRRWFEQRQRAYLIHATQSRSQNSILNLLNHLERAERDAEFMPVATDVGVDAFPGSWNKFDNYLDTADFDLLYLVNLWYSHGESLSDDLRTGIEDVMTGFKYWYTDPTPDGVVDDRWYWSENHRIIFHTLEYLAGQAFPEEVFAITGENGAWHQARAEVFIDEWLDEKVRFGFSEWHSDVYYQKDVTPLLSLVEFADDPVLAERAAMVLDLVLFDLAMHTLDGNNGVTHGRSYMKDKSIATDQDVFGIVKLLFDDTVEDFQSTGEAGASLLARAKRYRMPQVILDIATSDDPMIDRERMGVPVGIDGPLVADAEAPYGWERPDPPYGIDWDDPANVPFWWERGALTAWPVVPSTLDTIEQYDLWNAPSFQQFGAIRDIITNPDDTYNYTLAMQLAHTLRDVLNIGLLDEVNTYTYRTGNVMLSSAQDFRPGAHGNQYHAWQATLGSRAVVFTTHPGNEPRTGNRWVDADLYWNGTGSMPRSAQHGSAAIHIYAPAFQIPEDGPFADLLGSFRFLEYTHAWFPTEEFDEVVEQDGWVFGRKGNGYVALWSWRPTEWRIHAPEIVNQNGLTEPYDLVAPGGPDNVWLVEVADGPPIIDITDPDAGFAAFRAALVASTPQVTKIAPIEPIDPLSQPYGGFEVTWDSPSQGLLSFGTDGPFSVGGNEIALGDYPRYDNPWTQVPFDGRTVDVNVGERRLLLDFDTWARAAS